MIDRYTREPMASLWTMQTKFERWLQVELAAAQAWAKLGQVPQEAADAMAKKATFTVERIAEIEETTHHDVVAFTRCVAESLGEESRYLHFGLTSTDVVDTALSSVLKDAMDLIIADMDPLLDVLKRQAKTYKMTPCMGRTHGVHAEPTTLGLKFALWYADMQRCVERLKQAREMIAVGKLSGAVGNYANIDPYIEQYVCKAMGLTPAPISTQVLQRDRHAQLICTLAILGGCMEKIATEIRGLQKTETRELEEPFAKGQTGSSAMPHKRNPVNCEQICGLARLLRGYCVPALEDITLWHERDISHSSAERVILADATCLADYMLGKLTRILTDLNVYPENMMRSINASHGLVFSGRVLLYLCDHGMLREVAYPLVQRCAMDCWATGKDYKELLWAEPVVQAHISRQELDKIFDLNGYYHHVDDIFARLGLND